MLDDGNRPENGKEEQPLSAAPSVAPDRRVRCDLPDRINVVPGEVELIHHLLGELIPTLFE